MRFLLIAVSIINCTHTHTHTSTWKKPYLFRRACTMYMHAYTQYKYIYTILQTNVISLFSSLMIIFMWLTFILFWTKQKQHIKFPTSVRFRSAIIHLFHILNSIWMSFLHSFAFQDICTIISILWREKKNVRFGKSIIIVHKCKCTMIKEERKKTSRKLKMIINK